MIDTIFVNELFCFEPKKKLFLSHEELFYQLGKQFKIELIIFTNKEYHDWLITINEKAGDSEANKDTDYPKNDIISEINDDEIVNLSEMIDNEKDFNDGEGNEKSNYDLFLKTVDLKEFNIKISINEFETYYLAKNKLNLHKIAAYFYFREQGFLIDSGCTYGFDFLLYQEDTKELKDNKKGKHFHSKFSVSIILDQTDKLTYLDIQRKHRISNNYNKVSKI